ETYTLRILRKYKRKSNFKKNYPTMLDVVDGRDTIKNKNPHFIILKWGFSINKKLLYYRVSSTQLKNTRCQTKAFCGFNTQWFSSGNRTNLLFIPSSCAAWKACCPCSIGTL